jgi:hypothetical protein
LVPVVEVVGRAVAAGRAVAGRSVVRWGPVSSSLAAVAVAVAWST